MKAADIIYHIAMERGHSPIGSDSELVPLSDLKVHKKEVWSLSLTTKPESYFSDMDKKSGHKICYHFKFEVKDIVEGLHLCHELSKDLGIKPCEAVSAHEYDAFHTLYLAVHVHTEFMFSPTSEKPRATTQELVLNFV